MFSKNKYDVMEGINTKSSVSLLFIVGKVYKDLKLYENKKISKDVFEDRFRDALSQGVPSIKAICHVGYENSKDIKSVSEEELYSYIKKEGLTKDEFNSNYIKMVNIYVRVLLALNIIEQENIDICSVVNVDNLIKFTNGDFSKLKQLIEDGVVNVGDNNKCLVEKLIKVDFDVSMLTELENKKLEDIHGDYMDKNVNNKISSNYEKIKVLKYAKNLGKKKSVFEL